MNGMPRYVVSTTSEKLAWKNSHQVNGNITVAIIKLKQQPGQTLLVAGSGVLVQALMHHDLVDEYRLLVYPLVPGKGKHLFQDGIAMSRFMLDLQLCSFLDTSGRWSFI